MLRNIRLATVAAFAALTLTTSCAGTVQSTGPATSSVLDGVVSSGKLRVGMSADQPPLNVRGKSGQMLGLEVDLANALAAGLHVELEVVQRPFGQLLAALEQGEVDMVISGLDITAVRSQRFLFVGPYLLAGKSLVTTSTALANAQDLEDIDVPELTFVALEGSTSADFVQEYAPRATLVTTDTYEAAVEKVKDGSASAMIADYPACMLAVLRNPDAGLVTLREPLSIEPMGIAVSAADPRFYNLVDNFVDAFEASGLLTAMRVKWFESPAWLDELP